MKLFIPERHFHFSLPLIHILIVSLGMSSIIDRVRNSKIKVALIVAFVGIYIILYSGHIVQGIGLNIREQHNKYLYKYLQTLPISTFIAANPYLSDNISAFSQRKVFLKHELSHPWFKKYAHTIDLRIIDFYKAYYSISGKEIYQFCKKHKIDYIVIDEKDFDLKTGNPRYYTNPLNAQISAIVNNNVRKVDNRLDKLFLMTIPNDKKLYRHNEFFVIKPDEKTLL